MLLINHITLYYIDKHNVYVDFFGKIYYNQKNATKYYYSSVTINILSLILYSHYLLVTQILRNKMLTKAQIILSILMINIILHTYIRESINEKYCEIQLYLYVLL